MRKLIMMFALAGGCATVTPNVPYTSERAIDMNEHASNPYAHMPFSRQHAIDKVVTLHNPFDHAVEANVFCPGDIFEGRSNVKFTVPGHNGELRFLARVSSVDMYDNVCEVTDWHFVGLPE